MATEAKLKEWRKHHRQSLQALPAAIGFAVALLAALWSASSLFTIPRWFTIVVVGLSAFAVIGDAVNILYLCGKLHGAGRRDG